MTDKTQAFEPLRPYLLGLAYRALGSRADAEDVVQDAYLRWEAADTSRVESPKAFLSTVVARLALDQLKSARRKREEYFGVWLPEPVMTGVSATGPCAIGLSPEDSMAMAESLSTAFLFVLESLTPPERIAFLLHDVFGQEYGEIAETLETNEANCRKLVSRARQHVRERRPRFAVEPERHRQVLHQFLDACTHNDVAGLAALLREDVVTYSDGGGKALAAVNPIVSADHVARFFVGITQKAPADLTWRIEDAGGVPSLLVMTGGELVTLITLDLDDDGKIAQVLVQRNPDKLPRV